jgi:uncharacterized membrane protein
MIEFRAVVEIGRPVDEVFTYVTDPAKLSSWQTNTVSVTQKTDGPLGVGTRLREVHRAPGGRELASLVEVSEYESGRCFALRVLEGPLPVDGRFTFASTERGTRVELLGQGRPSGVLRLGQPLLGRILRRQFVRDLNALKSALEEPPGSAPSGLAGRDGRARRETVNCDRKRSTHSADWAGAARPAARAARLTRPAPAPAGPRVVTLAWVWAGTQPLDGSGRPPCGRFQSPAMIATVRRRRYLRRAPVRERIRSSIESAVRAPL